MRLAAAVVVLASACSSHVYTPPARPLPLQTSATLPAGRTSIGGEIGASSAIFGPDISSEAARVRRGLANGVELSAEGSHLHVGGTSATGVDQDAYAGALGVKINPGTKHLALTASTGYGTAAIGRYTSNEVGAILAFENRYFVPFMSVRVGVNSPLDRHPVDTASARLAPGVSGAMTTPMIMPSTPGMVDTTLFRSIAFGFKIPVGLWSDDRWSTVSIYAATAMTAVSDRTDYEEFLQAGLGVEVTF